MTEPLANGLEFPVLHALYESGAVNPVDVVRKVWAQCESHSDPAVWISRTPLNNLIQQAEHQIERKNRGVKLPLFGIPFAVKDNIDFAGLPTTAACPAYSYEPSQSAASVHALLHAGAIMVGKTNMDQFATGLGGDRSPFGMCQNPLKPEYISGGSSSGSAAAVSAGLVSFALGTDTAGSGRVPAGCCNIVGLKPTPGVVSTRGVVPACRTLDCVSVFALTVADAHSVFSILNTQPFKQTYFPKTQADWKGLKVAIPQADALEFYSDSGQLAAFEHSLDELRSLGAEIVPVDFSPLREAALLLYEGPWLSERWAAVGSFVEEHPNDVHPVIKDLIEKAKTYSAGEAFRGQYRLEELRAQCLKIFDATQVLVVPTMPALPTRQLLKSDSLNWSRRLGHYTNFVNLLGWAGLAVPAPFTSAGLPSGLTLLGPGGSDVWLGHLGAALQQHWNLPLGATAKKLTKAATPALPKPVPQSVKVAVAGAHLKGQPLHYDLLSFGAKFVRDCRTASKYRFKAFMDLKPPRPGVLQVEENPAAVSVEIYELPMEGFGRLVASVLPPLAIGTVELEDGEKVKGFLCESLPAAKARDITSFGGWVAFRKALESET